jgi:CRP-like cAMP-binding protein
MVERSERGATLMTPLASAKSDASEHLARKFAEYVPLTQEERLIVRDLAPEIRHVRRREDLVVEGNKSHAVFLVIEGIMMRYRILRDGRRQVVNLIIPGDFAGVPGCFFEGALYSIKAITHSTVAPISIRDLHGLFATHPRLAAKIFWSFSCDTAIYAEHIVVIGRRTALERVAHFLLELLTRLQVAGLADRCSYQLPLSQEMIGDAIGLSPAYVNRVMRKIIDEGLVTFSDQKITINDVEALSTLADFERGYLRPIPVKEFAHQVSGNIATPSEANSFARVM